MFRTLWRACRAYNAADAGAGRTNTMIAMAASTATSPSSTSPALVDT